MVAVRGVVFSAVMSFVAVGCVSTAPRDNQAMFPAGVFAANLEDRLDSSRLAENSPQELLTLLTEVSAQLPVAVLVEPAPSFPYLVTVTAGGDTACVVPDFEAIANRRPGPLTFSVREDSCNLDNFAEAFDMIVTARR